MSDMFTECYILAPTRDVETVARLKSFAGIGPWSSCSAIHEILDDQGAVIFSSQSEDEAMLFLFSRRDLAASLYWFSESDSERQINVRATTDGALIMCLADRRESFDADATLQQLIKFFSSSCGYVSYEQAPPKTAAEFHRICKSLSP